MGGAGVMVMAAAQDWPGLQAVATAATAGQHPRPRSANYISMIVHPQAGKSTRTRGAGQARASLVPAHAVDTGAAHPLLARAPLPSPFLLRAFRGYCYKKFAMKMGVGTSRMTGPCMTVTIAMGGTVARASIKPRRPGRCG